MKTGEVNWDYDWDRNMPYIAPGMVEGKEPLLDEWEVSQILHRALASLVASKRAKFIYLLTGC